MRETLCLLFGTGMLLLVATASCEADTKTFENRDRNEYSIDYKLMDMPGDTLIQNKRAEFVERTIEAASRHMTAGDYEDPEDVIEEATEQSFVIYPEKRIPVLHIMMPGSGNSESLAPWELNPYQKHIYDSLLNN